MAKYSFTCPACGHVVSAEAENDDQAVAMIMEQGGVHMKEAHPEMPPQEGMEQMVREQMKKEEAV